MLGTILDTGVTLVNKIDNNFRTSLLMWEVKNELNSILKHYKDPYPLKY